MPKRLAQVRTYALVVVVDNELGYLPLCQTAAELLFQCFSDRITTKRTRQRGRTLEPRTSAGWCMAVHRSHILLLWEGESYYFRQSLEQQRRCQPYQLRPDASSRGG